MRILWIRICNTAPLNLKEHCHEIVDIFWSKKLYEILVFIKISIKKIVTFN